MTNDNQFDVLLHDALGEYREAEPLAGIESRILARIHADASGRKSLGLRWAVALACAAAVVLAIWLGVGRRTPHTATPSEAAATKPVEKALAPALVASASGTVEVRKAVSRSVPQLPPRETAAPMKPAVFPSPSPLTAEERAFMAALNQSPNTVLVASEPDKAITIAEIEIKPLAIGGVSLGEKE